MKTLLTYSAALALSLASPTSWWLPRSDSSVGPIYFTEKYEDVVRALGGGSIRPHECHGNRPSTSCSRELAYHDSGCDILITFDKTVYGEAVVGIRILRSVKRGGSFPLNVASLTTWRWKGVYILRRPVPRRIEGWQLADAGLPMFTKNGIFAVRFNDYGGREVFNFGSE
jgi:hypothetical protein